MEEGEKVMFAFSRASIVRRRFRDFTETFKENEMSVKTEIKAQSTLEKASFF